MNRGLHVIELGRVELQRQRGIAGDVLIGAVQPHPYLHVVGDGPYASDALCCAFGGELARIGIDESSQCDRTVSRRHPNRGRVDL